MQPTFVLGLDLGQTTDFTALSVGQVKPMVQRLPIEQDPDDPLDESEIPTRKTFMVELQHLARLPKRMPYPTQVEKVGEVVTQVKDAGRVLLVIDHTSVGRPVVDMFRMARLGVPIWGVTIATSAMKKAKRDEDTGDWVVGKKDLVGALIALMHSERVKVARGIDPEILEIWTKEMRSFQMKFTAAANVTMEAGREGEHDDLVLATSLMAWAASRWATPGGLL